MKVYKKVLSSVLAFTLIFAAIPLASITAAAEESLPDNISENNEVISDLVNFDQEEAVGNETNDLILNDTESYVLMNIPYADFYKSELNPDSAQVDAVSSATKMKPRTGTLAAGSYHVNSDGSDISGIIYPVKISDNSILSGKTEITDASEVTIVVTNRGKTVTTTYRGKDALFESPDYSYYKLSDAPSHYKEASMNSGNISFSEIKGSIESRDGVTAKLTVGARHADIEMTLEGTSVNPSDAVSAVVLTFNDNSKLGLKHVVNIWRGIELGGSFSELGGKTVTNIRYYKKDGVTDYPVNIVIPVSQYALMNIPYADFYKAEGVDGVDTVTSATAKAHGNMATGSYHDGAEGTNILGVIYPVLITDKSSIDTSKKVVPQGAQSNDEALFGAGNYAYVELGEKPSAFKALTINNGEYSFAKVGVRASQLNDISASATVLTRRGDYEIKLEGANVDKLKEATVCGVILTTDDRKSFALRHLENIWKSIELAVCTGHTDTIKDGALTPVNDDYAQLEGKTVNKIMYYTRESDGSYKLYAINCNVHIPEYPEASFEAANKIKINKLSAEDAAKISTTAEASPKNYYSADIYKGSGAEKAVVASKLNIGADGSIELPENAATGTYTVEVKQTRVRVKDGVGTSSDLLLATLTADLSERGKGSSSRGTTPAVNTGNMENTSDTSTGADNTTAKVIRDKDGKVTSVEAAVSKEAVETASRSGKPVSLPVKINASSNVTDAAPISVALPDSGNEGVKIKLEIPINNSNSGIVVYIITEDGKPQLVKSGIATQNGVVVELDKSAKLMVVDNSKNFSDVGQSWSADAIRFVTAREIFNGTSANAFSPKNFMSRGMIAQVLYNFDSKAKASTSNGFSDISKDSWYADAVGWAAAENIVTGYSADNFGGEDNITREQMVAILYRYAEKCGCDMNPGKDAALGFADSAEVSDFAQPAMKWASATGIINGSNGRVMAKEKVSREQAAAIIMRFVALL